MDSRVPLTSLFRKCKVLAARLANADFDAWIDAEPNGYTLNEVVPQYRVMAASSKGYFSGPFQKQLRNADIPLLCIPGELRENLREVRFTQPIAAFAAFVKDSEDCAEVR